MTPSLETPRLILKPLELADAEQIQILFPLIGCISLKKSSDTNRENRGFWLGLPWHGRGLMTEAADAVTDYWFDTLKFPVLRVPKAAANIASRRVSEKQGMRVVVTDERDYVQGRMAAEIWEITADEWNRRRSG